MRKSPWETPGIYGEKDGMKYVSYEETKLAGMEGTTTTLEIHKDHVRLIRDGSFLQEQVYRIGEKNHSLYETPMGTMDIYVVNARDRKDSIEAGKGRMRLSYDDGAERLFNHLNEIIVEVREDPEVHGSQRRTERNH